MAIREVPNVPTGFDAQTRNFLSALREAVNNNLSAVNTLFDGRGLTSTILQSSLGGLSSRFGWMLDTTPPPKVANMTTTGLFSTIFVHWDYPGYANHSLTEIWRANALDANGVLIPVGNIAFDNDASIISTSNGSIYVDAVEPGSKYYYWARFASMADVYGPYNQVAGTLGETTQSIDAMMAAKGWTVSVEKLFKTGMWVGAADILNGAIDSFKIADFSVINSKIANLAVDTTKIANAAITNAKIALLAVGTAQIQDLAVTNAKIQSIAVEKLIAVTAWIKSADILDGAITNAKIGNTIQSANYDEARRIGWKMDKLGNVTVFGAITIASAGTGAARTEMIGDTTKIYNGSGMRQVQLGNLDA